MLPTMANTWHTHGYIEGKNVNKSCETILNKKPTSPILIWKLSIDKRIRKSNYSWISEVMYRVDR